jgi:hypothetical protein
MAGASATKANYADYESLISGAYAAARLNVCCCVLGMLRICCKY